MINTKDGSIKDIPFSKGQRLSLVIDSLATGGAGVGRYKGFVIFVPFTCPGDKILARVTRIKKNFAEAELVKVEDPAIERALPQCSVFQKCGGCTWQHISYSEQLKQKQKILESSLKKRLSFPSTIIQNIIASPKKWQYRNRIQLKVDQKGDYGFYEKKSHHLVKIKDCPISDPILFQNLDKTILKITNNLRENKIKNNVSKNKINKSSSFKKNKHQAVEVYLSEEGKVQYSVSGSQLNTDKKAFSQVNEWVNQILIKDVLKYLKKYLLPDQVVYDLYCGHGNFSFPINEVLKPFKTIGVELNAMSISMAKEEVAKNNRVGLDFINQDVISFLQQSTQLKGPVLLDPPRVGCAQEVLFLLNQLKPSFILYISCNPQTLVRDLEILTNENGGYEMLSVQPYDMFPQTDHIESLVVLSLKKRVGV